MLCYCEHSVTQRRILMIEDQNEIAEVRSNLAAWLEAFNEGALDKLFSLYDSKSLYANATAPLLRGIPEIRPWYEKALETFSGTLMYQEEAAIQNGSLAMLLGAYYFRPSEDQKLSGETEATGRVCLLYRKNENGQWKLLFDMDNTPPDITPEQFK